MNGNSEASPTASVFDAVITSSPLALAPIPASGWQDMCGGKKKKGKRGGKKRSVKRRTVKRAKRSGGGNKSRGDGCGGGTKKGKGGGKKRRKSSGGKKRSGGKRKKGGKGKKGKNGKRVYKFSGQKRLQIEYNIMIKRAIFRTQTCAGTNECRVLKYLKKWYNVNMFKVSRIVKRALNTMVTQGLLFKNKKNPVMFRVTLKGARLRSKLESRCRKKRKSKKGGKGKRRRGKKGTKKRRSIC